MSIYRLVNTFAFYPSRSQIVLLHLSFRFRPQLDSVGPYSMQVYKKTLTSKQCESVLNKINDSAWSPHHWTDYNKTVESKDINNDCTRAVLSNGVSRLLVSGLISNTVNEYRKYIKKY